MELRVFVTWLFIPFPLDIKVQGFAHRRQWLIYTYSAKIAKLQNLDIRGIADAWCSVSYTGYRYASASTSRGCELRRSFIGRCLASRHCISRLLPSCRRCSWVTSIPQCAEHALFVCCDFDILTFGDIAFAAAGPGLWNSLPSHPKEADLSYYTLCPRKKTITLDNVR